MILICYNVNLLSYVISKRYMRMSGQKCKDFQANLSFTNYTRKFDYTKVNQSIRYCLDGHGLLKQKLTRTQY